MATNGSELKLHSQSPTRIDLAGGTYDIWPLYLFLPEPAKTINLGIDLFSRIELTSRHESTSHGGKITLRSQDQKTERTLSFEELKSISPEPGISLHVLILRQFTQKLSPNVLKNLSLTVETSAQSPAGAGLGGSSSLAVSLVGAYRNWAEWALTGQVCKNWKSEAETLVDLVRDVETRVIQVPAGLQDYYGAMFGGLQRLSWLPSQRKQEFFPEDILNPLAKRLLLFYSGHSRNSGINNWSLFKGFIDQNTDVRSRFLELARATDELDTALLKQDWKNAGTAIAAEWKARKQLAAGISTPEIDEAIAVASGLGSTAAKICGAGGGGCFFVYLPDEDPLRAQQIRTKIKAACPAIRELPFHSVPGGSQVTVET